MNREQSRHNGNGDLSKVPMQVPILGQAVHTFVCKAGHVTKSSEAFRLTLFAQISSGVSIPAMVTGPACPICIGNYLAFMFPQWPEGMTMEMAVEQGILNPAVLPPAEVM